MTQPRRSGGINRRAFLRRTAGGLATAGLAAGRLWAQPADGLAPAESVVVDVRNPDWRKDGNVDAAAVRQMVEAALKAFTGKGSAADAWKQFVQADETVGVKFNRLSGDFTRANQAMVDAILDGLKQAGVPRDRIIVVEAVGAEVANPTEPDVRFGPEVDTGHGVTRLTRFVTDQIDCLINVHNLKDHAIAGVTGALKNLSHAGKTIMEEPSRFHGSCCDPHISEINLLRPIHSKRRLNLCNGFVGMFHGGPTPRGPRWQWQHNGLLVSTDPVAMDAVCLDLVQEARRKKRIGIGQVDLFETGRKPVHIATSARMGLGVDDRSRIKVIQVQG